MPEFLTFTHCSQWLAPIYVGQQVQEYNTDFYALIEKAAEFDTHLASQCAHSSAKLWLVLDSRITHTLSAHRRRLRDLDDSVTKLPALLAEACQQGVPTRVWYPLAPHSRTFECTRADANCSQSASSLSVCYSQRPTTMYVGSPRLASQSYSQRTFITRSP